MFSALVSPAEKNRLRNRNERKISVTSAVSDQSQFTSPIRRSNARVFAWILRQRVGKYGGRCVEERIGSFLVRKRLNKHQKEALRCFCEPSNWFRKVCSISGFVYCVFLCGTIKLEAKKPDALAGYSPVQLLFF